MNAPEHSSQTTKSDRGMPKHSPTLAALRESASKMKLNFPAFERENQPRLQNPEEEEQTLGQIVADKVTLAIGSWGFIVGQGFVIIIWIVANILGWLYRFDPYPFILLNLAMSAQAAFATPLIMKSQNRQAEKDRQMAQNDYLTDRRGEEEIRYIMDHLDHQDVLILHIMRHIELQHQAVHTLLKSADPELARQFQEELERVKQSEREVSLDMPPDGEITTK